MRKRMMVRGGLVSLSLVFLGCGGGALSNDVREVNDFLAAQSKAPPGAPRPKVEMPDEDRWEEEASAVPTILEKPLDADAAVRLALLTNRDLRAAMYEVGVARGKAVQAGLLPNPDFEFSVRVPQDKVQPLQSEVGLEYNITSLILLPMRKGVAEAELSAERVRVAGEVLDTAYRARVAFYEVQARQAALDLQNRALGAFQAGYAAAEELSRAGNLPDVDLVQHRAAVESARIDVALAENALLDAREQLNIAIGLSGERTGFSIAGPLAPAEAEEASAPDAEKRAMSASIELAEIGNRMQAAAKQVGLSKAEGALPHLSGGFHGEHDGFSWEIGGHVTVGLPVFDRQQGRVISAKSELGALRERYVATATALRASLRMAQNRVESAGKRARHYRDALLPARERALKETVLQYNAMQIGVFQLLEVQRQLTQTGISYVETLLDYWKARAALDQILAGRYRSVGFGTGAARSSAPMSTGGAAAGH